MPGMATLSTLSEQALEFSVRALYRYDLVKFRSKLEIVHHSS